MSADSTSRQIEVMFSTLNRRSAADAMPAPTSLSQALVPVIDHAANGVGNINAGTFAFFATAAVEMWHRSVHSFVVSASLTKASPLWASVSGYYSSHYTVRAFAHLLGYFHVQSKHRIVRVEANGNQYLCHVVKKNGSDREHKVYWKMVKEHASFSADPFFTKNDEGQGPSDSGHRGKANYADHLNRFPAFQVLDEQYLKVRVEKIAGMELSDAPIPRPDSYPDTDSVQLIAYHRMVKFRQFVDVTPQ